MGKVLLLDFTFVSDGSVGSISDVIAGILEPSS